MYHDEVMMLVRMCFIVSVFLNDITDFKLVKQDEAPNTPR